jgi:rubredoxin
MNKVLQQHGTRPYPELDIQKGAYFTEIPVTWNIRCPICGNGYNFPLKVREIIGGDYEAWEGRGHVAKIFMKCEPHSHYWNLCVGFHKGQSFLYAESLEVRDEDARVKK